MLLAIFHSCFRMLTLQTLQQHSGFERVKNPAGASFLQLQYSQSVLLNFNGLSWPHVTVGTLVKSV